MKKDLYEEIGVGKDADREEIKGAFRHRAKKLHPDVGGDADEFAALVLAYNVLSDDEKRAFYDETGEVRSANFEEEGARQVLVSEMIEVLSATSDYGREPLVENMRERLEEQQERGKAKLRACEAVIKNLIMVSERLKYKGEGQSHLHAVLENKKRETEGAIKSVQVKLRMLGLALTLLEDYEFSADALAYGWINTWNNTTTA